MFPSWARPALIRVGIVCVVGAVLLVGAKIVSSTMGQSPEPPRQQAKGDPAPPPVEERQPPVQPATPAKEPPLAKAGPTKPSEPTFISLIDAIGLVEKTKKGEVVLAEKVGAGDKAAFTLDVLAANGAKTRYNVNATGKVIVEVAIPAKKGMGGGNQGKDRKKGSSEREREREREKEREDR